MKLRKINMLVCGLAILVGCSVAGIACDTGNKSDMDNQQNNTGTQQNTTDTESKQDTTDTGSKQDTNIQQEENTNVKEGNADTPLDSNPKGNSENSADSEKTNSNDTEGKGAVTPGRIN